MAFSLQVNTKCSQGIDALEPVLQKDGFVMPFRAHLKDIELRPKAVVLSLLQEVRRYADMGDAPVGMDGCKDCGILEKMNWLKNTSTQ